MTEPEAGLSPVLLDEPAFTALLRWVGPLADDLAGQLVLLSNRLRGRLDERQRAEVFAAMERLRMLQIVEQGLAVGDSLPGFALPDADGRIWSSTALLDRGPLALAFVRGAWCPYCSLCLTALDRIAPQAADAGGSLAVVVPADGAELARIRAERGLTLTLLGDPDAAYARLCGVHYEMSDGQAALYRSFGLDLAALNDWGVPIPATYVAGRDGRIAYAFADPDWSRRAEPGEILASVRALAEEPP
jgi:peroxiredoxin